MRNSIIFILISFLLIACGLTQAEKENRIAYKNFDIRSKKMVKVHKLENKVLIHRPELNIEEAEILGLDVKFLAITGEFKLK